MRYAAILGLALLIQSKDDFATLKAKAEAGFAEEGLKLADELLKKGHAPEARLIAGIVATRVAASKEKAEKLAADAKAWKGKAPAGKDAETKVPAFGKKWAGEWRKAAKAASKDQAKEGARLDVEAEILDALWEHAKAYALFNRRRAEAGVPTVEYDFALAYGCQMHARYLVKNPGDGHEEDKAKDGYSEEGARAGENGLLGRKVSLLANVDGQLATVYHRAGMIEPRLLATGSGLAGRGEDSHVVVDVASAISNSSQLEPVAYPPDGATDAYLLMWPERPSPLDTELDWKVGYPVTLGFYEKADTIRNATIKLLEQSGKTEVPCWISTPEKPATDKFDHNDGMICGIPKKPLKARTKYLVVIEWEQESRRQKREWSFSTSELEKPN